MESGLKSWEQSLKRLQPIKTRNRKQSQKCEGVVIWTLPFCSDSTYYDSSMPATHCILLFPKQKKTLCASEFQVANSLGVTTQRFKNSFINTLFIKNNLAI